MNSVLGRDGMTYEHHMSKHNHHRAFADTVTDPEFADWALVAYRAAAYHLVSAQHVKHGLQSLLPYVNGFNVDLMDSLQKIAPEYTELENRSRMALYDWFSFGEGDMRWAKAQYKRIFDFIQLAA